MRASNKSNSAMLTALLAPIATILATEHTCWLFAVSLVLAILPPVEKCGWLEGRPSIPRTGTGRGGNSSTGSGETERRRWWFLGFLSLVDRGSGDRVPYRLRAIFVSCLFSNPTTSGEIVAERKVYYT